MWMILLWVACVQPVEDTPPPTPFLADAPPDGPLVETFEQAFEPLVDVVFMVSPELAADPVVVATMPHQFERWARSDGDVRVGFFGPETERWTDLPSAEGAGLMQDIADEPDVVWADRLRRASYGLRDDAVLHLVWLAYTPDERPDRDAVTALLRSRPDGSTVHALGAGAVEDWGELVDARGGTAAPLEPGDPNWSFTWLVLATNIEALETEFPLSYPPDEGSLEITVVEPDGRILVSPPLYGVVNYYVPSNAILFPFGKAPVGGSLIEVRYRSRIAAL